ncbi:ABC-type transport system involved in multi-copper enzyme maturation permease subunit [Virgibacillus natechei]|uniref:ABC-type transport system involved in multi-copper enzyme maturation permease subunit n=1 Tax=Virgibacillus natechei TaxID=1216297 RepID=A0ABS4IGF0_9BACI|nr:ABC transporter permease [Virgibacillus natechei]MBP1970005.1 ABC-type transport system involved in multi-copper enzyme maturation permease subunit [Virgibacillus natechei]
MRDKNIQPILPLGINSWITVYDIDFGVHSWVEEFVKDRSTKYSSSALYFLHHFFQMLFGLIGPVFFLLLLGDTVTKEGLGRNGPIHLLRTQPIHRYKILLSKLFAGLAATVLVLLGTSLFAILIGTIFDRFGSWDYPVLIYGHTALWKWAYF